MSPCVCWSFTGSRRRDRTSATVPALPVISNVPRFWRNANGLAAQAGVPSLSAMAASRSQLLGSAKRESGLRPNMRTGRWDGFKACAPGAVNFQPKSGVQ